MTKNASHLIGLPRELLLSVSGLALTSALTLALADSAAAADECGAVGTGRTVTCTSTGNPYANGITYTTTDAATVVLDGDADTPVVINSGAKTGVSNQTTRTDETRGLAITATGPVTITTTGSSAYGLYGRHYGLGDVTITSAADITTDGPIAHGLYGQVSNPESTGTVSVSATGGTITTTNGNAHGLYGLHSGLGDVTVRSAADISTRELGAVGLLGQATNSASTGTVSVSATGGTITTTKNDAYGLAGYHQGSGDVTVTSAAEIKTDGSDAYGLYGQAANLQSAGTLTVSATGGTIETTKSNAHGLYGIHRGLGDVMVTSAAEIKTGGSAAYGLFGNANNSASTGTVSLSATGGAITTTRSSAYGLYGSHSGLGDVTITSAADISTVGLNATGLYGHAKNSASTGTLSLSATGGAITTTNANAYGLYGLHSGLGDVTVTSAADISTGGLRATGLYGRASSASTGTVSVSATGGTITTTNNDAYGLYGFHTGLGDVTVTSVADISTRGSNAIGLYGQANNPASTGTVSVSATGGSITTTGSSAHGLYGYHSGLGDVTVTSGAAVSTGGNLAHGLFSLRDASGLSRVAVTDGTVRTAGSGSDGLRAESQRSGSAPLGAIADIDVAGIVETTGADAAGIRVVAGDTSGATTPNDGANASAVIGIAAGGRVSSAQAVAITEAAPSSGAPVAIDTALTIAGTVATGVASGTAVDLFTGNDRVTLLPTAAVTGAIDGGDGSDSFILNGQTGTSGVLNLDTTPLLNFENYAKNGAGAWTLTGTSSTIAGSFMVNDGLLTNNASLPNAAFMLNGGAIGGSGTVGTVVVDAGSTIAPGNSIGTLNVAGNTTFQPGSTFEVEVDGSGNADRLVSDTVTINGGKVKVVALDPEASYVDGRQSLIIDTANGVSGTFDDVTDSLNSAFVNFSLIYTADDVLLQANVVWVTDPEEPAETPNGTPLIFPAAAITDNQFASSYGLNGLSQAPDSDSLYVFNQILSLPSFEAAQRAFDLSSGEIHASLQNALGQSGAEFTRTLRRRAGLLAGLDGTSGSLGGVATSYAPLALAYGEDGSDGKMPGVFPVEGEPLDPTTSRTLGVWTAAFAGGADWDGDPNRSGSIGAGNFESDEIGVAVGIEGRFDELMTMVGLGASPLTLGLAGGYSESDLDVAARLSEADIQTGHIGYYAASELFGLVRLSSAGSVAFSNVETDRRIRFGAIDRTATADYDAVTFTSSGEVSVPIALGGGVTVSPLVAYDLASVSVDGFRENGAGALNLKSGDDDYTHAAASVGAAFTYELALGGMPARLDARLAYEYGFGDHRPDRRMKLAGAPSTPFTVRGVDADDDRFAIGFGAAANITETITATARYDGAFGDDTEIHSGRTSIGFRF
ncbi:autotransporter domain-containing protein [Fulvimarina sp. MAC8]|uniref:autotransporter domain-containing protein n=1 Tax=Fulvimarina sp. MAC8 TaxID=3162874 RepID=UPI0032EDD329